MSWRIAVDTETAALSPVAFDFVVGVTGDAAACVAESWEHGPIAVWFCTDDGLRAFLSAWTRSPEDVWRIWRVQDDGTGELVAVMDHPWIHTAIKALQS